MILVLTLCSRAVLFFSGILPLVQRPISQPTGERLRELVESCGIDPQKAAFHWGHT